MRSNGFEISFEHVKPVQPVSPDEFARIRRELTGRDGLIADVMYMAGARPGEVLGMSRSHGLRWCDISQDEERNAYLVLFFGKTLRFRRAFMFEPLPARLEAHRILSGADLHDYVFPSRDRDRGSWTRSEYANWSRRVFKPACIRAGLPDVTPFRLRHGYADLVYRSGSGLSGLVEAIDISTPQAKAMYSTRLYALPREPSINPSEEIKTARQNAENQDSPDSTVDQS